MARLCPICASAEATLKCESLLTAKAPLDEIAAALGVSKFTISRHKRHVKLTEAEQSPEDKLSSLYDRCESLFHSFAASGDSTKAADIVKVQARLAESIESREKAKAEAEQTKIDMNNPNHAMTPAELDRIVADYDQKKAAARAKAEAEAIAGGYITCPLCGSGNFIHPSTIATRWATCRDIYNSYCDARERNLKEQDANVLQ